MLGAPSWSWRPAALDDSSWMAELKATAMRPDLERLGRWDPRWARRRFTETYVPANTRVIVADDEVAGCIALRPEPDAWWIEHFHLWPRAQGQGLGSAVLRHVMDLPRRGLPLKPVVVRGSAARHLYERLGFVHHYDDVDGVDQVLVADTV